MARIQKHAASTGISTSLEIKEITMKRMSLLLILAMSVLAVGFDAQAAPKKKRPGKKAPALDKADFADDSTTKVECKGNPKYHYRVYLPMGYNAEENKKRRYPMVLVSDPHGNAKLRAMGKWVRENQWIAVMLVEARNKTPWKTNEENFWAAMKDAYSRFRIHKQMVVGAGFSGGSSSVSKFAAMCPSINALLQSGGPVVYHTGAPFSDANGKTVMVKRKLLVGAVVALGDYAAKFGKACVEKNIKGNVQILFPNTGHAAAREPQSRILLDWIQQKFYLNYSIPPETAEQFYGLCEKRYSAAETAYEKYVIRDFQKRFIVKQRINKSKEQRARYKAVNNELLKLKREKSVKAEFSAQVALKRLRLKMACLLGDVPTEAMAKHRSAVAYGVKRAADATKAKAVKGFKIAYAAISKKYPDTQAAVEAQKELALFLKAYGVVN
jgi:hypothetical protein